MPHRNLFPFAVAVVIPLCTAAASAGTPAPIRIGFLWHMHQPIYYPYEPVTATDAANRFSFSVVDVHNQRFGPYTTWPRDAIQAGLSLPHLGAQVSFTGSLIENLNTLEAAGINGGMWNNWDGAYDQAYNWTTSLGNKRIDLVAFGYHHPLMPLLDQQDLRMQIKLHKHIYAQTFTGGSAYSRGMFPPETAFHTRMIPALAAEGIDWVLVDNIHFDRACVGYPHNTASNLFQPNPADQINPDPADSGGAWVQLNNLWAPSRVSVPFGYQPHYAQHVDPQSGAITRMIVVPAARYEGNEDGRGGYGAFLYDQVMDQYLAYNTDAQHPMFVMLHHDGDNFGGGSESYYHHNFQNMVSWVSGDPDYEVSTVDDYLDRFPVDPSDVIHVEPGSWAGADNGDPEFKKWLGDPQADGWSPDRNSWAVLTAAKHRVFFAEHVAPAASMQNVLTGAGSGTERAWHYLLCAQASDYWYWDGTEIWDSNVTRGCNLAVQHADPVIAGATDDFPPTIFLPQREPYNPGGFEWGATPEPTDFEVWTCAYDVSGLSSVTLYYRTDHDGANPLSSIQNETYAGGPEVDNWKSVAMTGSDVPPPAGILSPTYRALRYGGMITGETDVLIDYYVEAIDTLGNVVRSDIQHVYVGQAGSSNPDGGVQIDPDPALAGQPVAITYDGLLLSSPQVYAHVGFNGWSSVINPDPAMSYDAQLDVWTLIVSVPSGATMLDLAFNDGAGNWDNNSGADWHFTVSGTQTPGWNLDGQLDPAALEIAVNGTRHLWAGLDGDTLYVATEDAGEGDDVFIYVASPPGALRAANWAKAGQVADWAAFLADENDNDFTSWFDAAAPAQAATGANGGVFEGTLNIRDEFGGTLPAEVCLAVGVYATQDGGALQPARQVPASSDGDGNLDETEYLCVPLAALVPGCPNDATGQQCDTDLNADCIVNNLDLGTVLAAYLTAAGDAAYNDAADLNGDNVINNIDLGELLADYLNDCR